MKKTHSSIGASSMYRWSRCAASVRLSDGIKAPTSRYAAEGTCAHGVAETCLSNGLDARQYLGEKRTVEGFEFVVDDEMVEAVQLYLDTVRGSMVPGDELFVEHKFDISEIYDGLFGTADAVVWKESERLLLVFDFKYGAGIPVDVRNNPQLNYYALGALITLKLPVLNVRPTIVQPRCFHPDGHVRSFDIDALDMMDFKVDLIDYAMATEDPNAPMVSGDHCRFCPASAVCPAKMSEASEAAALVFAEPYDAEKLAEALRLAPIVEAWAESVRQFAYAQAESGKSIPGYKLVEKVARRKWIDVGKAEAALKLLGLGETEMYPVPELKSPSQIEEVFKAQKMKPKDRDAVIAPLVEKVSSGHTLAPESDKRPAVVRQIAEEAFA